MTADRSLDLRRWRRWAQGVSLLMALSGLLVAAVWWLNRVEQRAWANSGPEEGYWTVAQYQIAFGRLREELRVAASGGAVEAAMLDLRVDILQSRTNILTERSELTTYYSTIKGYRKAAERLAAFGQTVLPLVARAGRDPARAAALLEAFDDHETAVLSLANDVRLEEVRARELSLEGILIRRRVVITILCIAWVLMAGLLVQVYVSSSRLEQGGERSARPRWPRRGMRCKARTPSWAWCRTSCAPRCSPCSRPSTCWSCKALAARWPSRCKASAGRRPRWSGNCATCWPWPRPRPAGSKCGRSPST